MVSAMEEALGLVETIPGWLLPEDAAKLFELASRSSGPILEIGTYYGKSAILMASAIKAAGRDTTVYSLDVDANLTRAAASEAKRRGVGDRIVFIRGTVSAFARAYPHLRPALTFVDGDHSFPGVQRDLLSLQALTPNGGLLLFHDFDDPRNDDPGCAEVKVRPAIEGSWVSAECEFCGTFGVCGLYERQMAPPQPVVSTVDLLRLDSAREQYLQRVRYPAGRLWRKLRPGGIRGSAPS